MEPLRRLSPRYVGQSAPTDAAPVRSHARKTDPFRPAETIALPPLPRWACGERGVCLVEFGSKGMATRRALAPEFLHLLAIRGEDLEVVDTTRLRVGVGPDDFLGTVDFGHADFTRLGSVTGDDRVAIRKALDAARILDGTSGEIIVGDLPHNLGLGIELHHHVSVGATDEGIAIGKTDRGECPVRGLRFPHNLARPIEFTYDLVEQVRHEEVTVLQAAGHPGLHVEVGQLTLDRDLQGDVEILVQFKDPRFRAGFSDHVTPFGKGHDGVDFVLSALPFGFDLARCSQFEQSATGEFLALGNGEQDVAVLEDPSVPSRSGVGPGGGAVFCDDSGLTSGGEEGVLKGTFGLGGLARAKLGGEQ